MRRLGIVAWMAILVLALSSLPAFAGKGGQNRGGGKADPSTLAVALVDSADSVVNHLDDITFDVVTQATDRPFVGVRCWQGANWVYDGYVGFFETYLFDPWLTLDSPYWTPGEAADCEARLFYWDKRGREKVLQTIGFTAHP